jgi:hypothetical protein
MSKTVAINLVANTKEAEKNIENVAKEVENTNKATTELSSAFDKATGGMVSKAKGALTSVKNLGQGFIGAGTQATKMGNLIKIALTSTGIGALLVAFGSLVTFFTQTQRGADAVAKAMDGVRAAVAVIVDRVSALGEILTNLFNQPFLQTLLDVKDNFSGIGEEIANEATAASNLRGELQKLKDEEISLIAINAQRRKGIDEARLAAEDETLSIGKRVEALDKAAALENAILEDQLRIARERARISQEQVDLGESTREEIEENARLQATVAELESQSLRQQRTIATRRNALVRQQAAEEKAALKERADALMAANQAVDDVNADANKQFKARLAEENKLVGESLIQRQDLYKKNKTQEVAIERATTEQKIGLASQAFGAIAGLLGENSKAGKAAAIAQATINTYQGVTAALKADAAPFVEPFATITRITNAASILATGLQAVRTIKSQPLPQVRVAPSFGGGGGGAAVPSPPSFNVVGASPESQLAQAVSGQMKEPVKAYVVAGEVTTAQSLERNTIKEASI